MSQERGKETSGWQGMGVHKEKSEAARGGNEGKENLLKHTLLKSAIMISNTLYVDF